MARHLNQHDDVEVPKDLRNRDNYHMKYKKSALVTGCNGDIGFSICEELSKEGFLIIGTDLDKKAKFDIDFYISCELIDFVHDDSIRLKFKNSVIQILNENKSVLKVLVNNAALQIAKPFDELTTIDFLNSHIVNSVAPFTMIKLFESQLRKSKGSIVNIGSIHSKLTKPNFCAYSTSKASLSGLTRALSIELSKNITVNTINPGAVETKMLLNGFEGNLDKIKELKKFHPAGKIAKPGEISKLVIFLCTNNNGFITGSEISIDGGIGSRLNDPI